MNTMFWKKKIYTALDLNSKTKLSTIVNFFLFAVIVFNIPILFLETFSFQDTAIIRTLFFTDCLVTAIFIVEYLLRIYSCTEEVKYAKPFWGRLKFALTPMMIVDFISSLPFFLINMQFLQLIRILRIFRLIKLARYSKALNLIFKIFKKQSEELIIFFVALLMILTILSFLLFYAEHTAQPDKFKTIFDSIWCTIITLTSVGFGDIAPITNMGRLISGITAVLGLVTFAIPTAVLAAGFMQELQQHKNSRK